MAFIPSFTLAKPVFQPAMRVITAITTSNPATITTSIPHQYVVNTIVRLDIPVGFGMPQANQAVGTILSVPTPTTFTVSIDTTLFQPFTPPNTPVPVPPQTWVGYQDAQVVPIGESNSTLVAAVQNVLPYTG